MENPLDQVTPLSHLVTAQPRASLDQLATGYAARASSQRLWGEYTSADVTVILGSYLALHRECGVDPLLAVAQMSLETAWLTSYWAARPRRNPAGIGVTGQPGAGVSFPSWQVSTRAHAGRLLAYALPQGTGTTVQRSLIAEALAWRPLADAKRGTGATLGGLARSWAADPQYAVKVARIANQLLNA
jgi:flagellum-specific peptidoglycan hydrolase FlgJ